MKAKACTKCRQWKARCDASDGVPGGCSRCRSLNLTCVFDASFKRMSKGKRLQQMSTEIQQLRRALHNPATSDTGTSPQQSEGSTHVDGATTVWEPPQLQGTPDATTLSPSLQLLPLLHPTANVQVQAPPLAVTYRTLGDVRLTQSQIASYFKTYFARHHRSLPFAVYSESPDEVYGRSPLLFWVICAVTSSWKLQSQLAPPLRAMIAETIHASTHSVDTIQALLIMCIWPFKSVRLAEDPSQFYCSIATQMALQLGLHRPGQPYWPLRHGALSGPSTVMADEGIRLTTWLACYTVNQIQASHLGVPSSILADANLLAAFDSPAVEPVLSQLCRIYHFLMQSSWEISANAPTPTGMVDPAARLAMVRHHRKRLTALEQQFLAQAMEDVVKVSLLYARLQLCSFALLDDVPLSEDLVAADAVGEAEAAARELIDVAYGTNLAAAPVHSRRAMCYAAFVLIRLLQLPYNVQREVARDSIERVHQCFSTGISAPDDINLKACAVLEALPYVQDKHRSPPIMSRMGASIFYDTLRVYSEHCLEKQMSEEYIDIDRFDWSSLGM